MTDNDKTKRADEIKNMLKEFSAKHLNDELLGYAIRLLEKLARKRTLSITKGKREIWAASIIYVIARLNFLFDKENQYVLTADTICKFFGCSKSTIGNKATSIEQACNLSFGAEGFCSPEISDALTLVELPNGMIATKSMVKGWGSTEPSDFVCEVADPETEKELHAFMAEKERQRQAEQQKRIQHRTEINRRIADEKKKKKNKSQLSLFDD
jgi:hypothetical protein